MDQVDVAIVGATGAVGEVMLEILEQRNFPLSQLTLLASARSAGKTTTVGDSKVPVIDARGENSEFVLRIPVPKSASLSEVTLTMGEREIDGEYIVDTSHLVAYEEHMKLKVQLAGGVLSSIFGGEGLVTRVEGKGRIIIQTRSLDGLKGWLNPKLFN